MFGTANRQQNNITVRTAIRRLFVTLTLLGLLSSTINTATAKLTQVYGSSDTVLQPRSLAAAIPNKQHHHRRGHSSGIPDAHRKPAHLTDRADPRNDSVHLHPRYATQENFHNVPMAVPRVWNDENAEGLASIEGMTTSTPQGFLNPRHLWPTPWTSAWTTHPSVPGIHTRITHYPLGDANMGVTKISSGTSRNIVPTTQTYKDTYAWEAFYPKGSINPGNANAPRGGFGWYMAGPGGEWAFDQAREIMISYAVMFQPGFMFNLGGKLPGPYGGSTPDFAYGCSGGRQEDRDKCFSLRLMWRENGDGELYAYLPLVPENSAQLLAAPPYSYQDSSYGFSVGRGSWKFVPGEWSVLSQRVKLNDLGVANGEIEIWHNGDRVIHVTGLVIRQAPNDSKFRGIHFQTFFGGSSAEWASPQDQRAYFSDVTGSIIRF